MHSIASSRDVPCVLDPDPIGFVGKGHTQIYNATGKKKDAGGKGLLQVACLLVCAHPPATRIQRAVRDDPRSTRVERHDQAVSS